MMQSTKTTLLRREDRGGSYFLLAMDNPFRTAIRPGQFVMLSPSECGDPFLKRPYSIFRVLPPSGPNGKGELHLLIKKVGKGSAQAAELPPGTEMDIVGPLGRPFEIRKDLKTVVFVAGGVGVAPFIWLAAAKELRSVRRIALIGGRKAEDIQGVADLEALDVEVRTATEDGSLGKTGRVTLLLEEILQDAPEGLELFSCGPEPMMKAVGRIAEKAGIPCQLSLEARMACGFGVCLGCVVKARDGSYVRVCKEGPVFPSTKLAEYGGNAGEED